MLLMIRLVIQRISLLQISVRVQLLTEVLAALGRNYRVIATKLSRVHGEFPRVG